MPILASVDVSSSPVVVVDPDRRRLDFAMLDGTDVLSTSEFEGVGGVTFVAQSGVTGLRMAPRSLRTGAYQGLDGARLEHVSVQPRDVVVPMFVIARDHDVAAHLAQMTRMRAFMDHRAGDYRADEGVFDLVATGQGGAQRRLRCVYVDGMEGSEGVASGGGSFWSSFDVKLRAVDPDWRGVEWSTPLVQLPSPTPFTSTNPADAWPRQLAPTVAIGTGMPVTVTGDVPSPAVLEITGPATQTVISSPSGLSVTVGSLTAGQTFVLDTGRQRRALLDGAPAWTKIGRSPQWRPLPPGETTISIVMTGATGATRARVYGQSRWESAW